jgi:hypothetical protein
LFYDVIVAMQNAGILPLTPNGVIEIKGIIIIRASFTAPLRHLWTQRRFLTNWTECELPLEALRRRLI